MSPSPKTYTSSLSVGALLIIFLAGVGRVFLAGRAAGCSTSSLLRFVLFGAVVTVLSVFLGRPGPLLDVPTETY